MDDTRLVACMLGFLASSSIRRPPLLGELMASLTNVYAFAPPPKAKLQRWITLRNARAQRTDPLGSLTC
jgi:hypothetical protein